MNTISSCGIVSRCSDPCEDCIAETKTSASPRKVVTLGFAVCERCLSAIVPDRGPGSSPCSASRPAFSRCHLIFPFKSLHLWFSATVVVWSAR
jgi:hypothetical protein